MDYEMHRDRTRRRLMLEETFAGSFDKLRRTGSRIHREHRATTQKFLAIWGYYLAFVSAPNIPIGLGFLVFVLAVSGFASHPIEAQALEIKVSLDVIQEAVERELFKKNGKYYLAENSGCDYAFLEQPRIEARDNRIWLHAHFSGRKAIEVRGECIGPGDSFDVAVSGRPSVDSGSIGLAEIHIERPGNESNPFYMAISHFLEGDLPDSLNFDLETELLSMLAETQTGPISLSLRTFNLKCARTTPGGILLSAGVSLTIDVRRTGDYSDGP